MSVKMNKKISLLSLGCLEMDSEDGPQERERIKQVHITCNQTDSLAMVSDDVATESRLKNHCR